MTAQPSMKDVATLAKVSIATVSNVLNRPHLVAPSTCSKVLQAIEELGFIRNETARQLRVGRSRTIGLVVLDITNPFFTDLARGVEDAANAEGLSVILCNTDEHVDKENRYLQLLAEQRVQGVLIVPVDIEGKWLSNLRDQRIPVVLLDRESPLLDQCSVSVDDVAGGRLAAQHLIALGHRKIAFIYDNLAMPQVADRRAGAVREASRSRVKISMIDGSPLNVAGGRRAGDRIAALAPDERPTAVICANDLIAIGLEHECIRRGIRVPVDLAIVGYDDIDFAESAATPLTSLRQPRHELGFTAAKLVLEEAYGASEHRHRHVVFEPELVVRSSCGGQALARSSQEKDDAEAPVGVSVGVVEGS
jgi:LacI family transcriptional regulator